MRTSDRPAATREEYHKLLHKAATERLTDGKRSMFIAPAYDFGKEYGRHSCELTFVEKRKGLVIECRFFTGWNIKGDTLSMDGRNIEFMCTGFYYHFDDQKEAVEMSSMPHHTEECVLSGGSCYGVAGSALYGDVLLERLVHEGSPAIWDEIDKEFKVYGR